MFPAAAAMNGVAVAPAGNVTDPGTASKPLLLASDAVTPPTGAAIFRLNEQFDEALGLKVPGAQAKEESAGTAIAAEPTTETGKAEPAGFTPAGFEMDIADVVALGASVICAFAITPDPNVLVFKPVSRQV